MLHMPSMQLTQCGHKQSTSQPVPALARSRSCRWNGLVSWPSQTTRSKCKCNSYKDINRKEPFEGDPNFILRDQDVPSSKEQDFAIAERKERQRVWDAMRVVAAHRYVAGEMPKWFNPEWLEMAEEPTSRLREYPNQLNAGSSDALEYGGTGNGGAGGGSGGQGSGGGDEWSEEEDPYGMMRSDGHPMRWLTFAFAATLAAGGLATALSTGNALAMQLGWAAAAGLVVGAASMSSATCVIGALGVKLAWGVCFLIFAGRCLWGWSHTPTPRRASAPEGIMCGLAALIMCTGYMLTDMSALGDISLPTNPGGVFKSPDVAYRSSVWQQWGYGQVHMRV